MTGGCSFSLRQTRTLFLRARNGKNTVYSKLKEHRERERETEDGDTPVKKPHPITEWKITGLVVRISSTERDLAPPFEGAR
jgi:hypothetical protein